MGYIAPRPVAHRNNRVLTYLASQAGDEKEGQACSGFVGKRRGKMSKSRFVGVTSDSRRNSGSLLKSRRAAAVLVSAAAIAPLVANTQWARATLTWDPGMSNSGSGGGSG